MGQKGISAKGNGGECRWQGGWLIACGRNSVPSLDCERFFPPVRVAPGEPWWSQCPIVITVDHKPCGAEWGTPWILSKMPEPG